MSFERLSPAAPINGIVDLGLENYKLQWKNSQQNKEKILPPPLQL